MDDTRSAQELKEQLAGGATITLLDVRRVAARDGIHAGFPARYGGIPTRSMPGHMSCRATGR